MKNRAQLPRSLEELQKMTPGARATLWARYSPHPFKRQMRALWYYIACENARLHIAPKHITKIRKYMENPNLCMDRAYKLKYNLNPGTEIVKTFRGLEFKVLVADNGDFLYAGRTYKTLSAVAKEICGKKVSGPDFFGLDTKKAKEMINAQS